MRRRKMAGGICPSLPSTTISSSSILPIFLLFLLISFGQLANGARRRQAEGELQITVYPAELSVREGREASFECRARAADNSAYPTVRWTRVGGRLPEGVHESGSRLVFPQAQLAHTGRYVCVATHRRKTVEAYAQLHVQSYGPQEFQGDGNAVTGCMAGERACGSNECVKMEYVCDGERDCRDGSDEQNCPAKRHCEPNEFRCNNDKCVQKMWLCDGDDDCGDRSDEQNCGQRQAGDMCQPTEFRCADGRQCVPQSFQCDGTNDCQDGSDEIGCVQPTVVAPPQSNLVVPQGGEFKLTCRAVGVPDPYINWRLNWADVCEPPRCQQASEGGVGTLTVQNAQPMDQGAYTCEAINVRGRVLATPDCIVRIVSIPAPQPPPAEPARLTCNAQGSYSPYSDTRGVCQCKPLTTGPTCSQCSPGAYNLNEKAPQGCLKCFCFGVADRCHSSSLFRTKEKMFFGGDAQGIELSDAEGRTQPGLQFDFEQYGFMSHKEPHFQQTLYWKMPQRFLGNKVTAYGGDLAIKLLYDGSGQIRNEPLVVLRGNGMTLVHRPKDQESLFSPGREFTVTVPTYEQHYEHRDGRGQASREDLMMALADLDLFLIRATHTDDQTSTSLGDTSWEIAVGRDTQEERALEVEQCECPPGYQGSSCEDCAPGYERAPGPYLGVCVPARQRAPPPPVCSAPGALSAQPQWDGRCQCKQNVVGATCDRCAPESFNLSPQNPGGCLRCWCSGVTAVCESSHWRRSQVELNYARGDQDQLEAVSADARNPYTAPTQPQVYDGALQFNGFGAAPQGTTLYWALPQKFLGDKVTAYGGKLRYTVRFTGSGSRNTDADVILRGNDAQLEYVHRGTVESDEENTIEVPLSEAGWRRSQDGQAVNREQFLMALADLDAALIKMSYMSDCSSSSLLSVQMDIADAYGSGERALDVEQCQCPPGYQGTSCEICASGYSRTQGGPYMGLCERCDCNNHASQCDSEYGACLDCQHNTEGDRCERCKPGFVGDARRGTPHDCVPAEQPARPPCQCYNHSPRGCDSYGRCIQCEHSTEGFHCEVCKKGYYGDATKGTPYDCTPCPCPGDRECFLDNRGQVQCKNCPPGYGGRLCDECAPGYTRSRTSGGRECEPIGRHLPSEVEFVPAPEGRLKSTTTPEPGLQLGDIVDIEGPSRVEEAVEQGELIHADQRGAIIVDPDQLLADTDGRGGGGEEELEEEEEGDDGGEQPTPPAPSVRVHQFTGTTALAMPPDRGQQLDRVDLEVQIRPQSPNGMILYAATTAPSPKEPPPLVHSLELENGRPKYSFRVGGGGETYEVLLADVKLPLDQWSTLRVMNDGQGRASLRVNSGPPSELFYHPPRTPPAPSPSPVRIFLGGIDPRAQQPSDSVNFIGTIGRVRLNQKNLELDKGTEGGAERMRGRGDGEEEESHLAQAENQCSREPCRNGGQCRLDRFGSFQCQCRPGFGGRLCEFPSADGVCPEDGRRWCHRGICSWQRGSDRQQQRKLLCLCPPGWRGERCGEAAREEGDGGGIRFDGKHSFLAIAPLGGEGGAEEEEGEEATGRGFSMEFRLSPATRRAGVEEQLVAMLMGTERDGAEGRMAALGMEGGRLWALQREEGELPTTKRFLSKRIKAKKTHRIRLEQVGPGEVRLLVGGRPKGVLRVPTDSSAILLLGGMPPRGIAVGPSMADHLAGIGHFEGCLDGLSVNGRRVGWQELAKMHGASLGRCQPKGESTEEEEEPKKEEGGGGEFIYTTDFPATTPFTPLPVVSISEDPLLAGHEQRGQLMGPEEGEAIDWAERGGEWDMDEPIQLTGTISPDPLPSSTELGPLATAEVGEESVEEAEEKEEEAPEEPPWTTSAPSTTTATIDEEEEDEWLMTTLVPAPAKPTPTWMTGPDSAELEGPFAGLCDPKTCGAHGSCEEVNTTHVLCICRDYWVGQQCEQFRPIEYAASFDGNAFVVFSSDEFPHLVSDREEIVEFKLRTRARYGLLFWQGQQPSSSYHLLDDEEEEDMAGEDFLSIGLLDGHLAFSYELGGGAAQLISEQPVNDGRPHLVRAIRKGRNGSLEVDGGTPVRGRSSGILAMLNVEGHIFVGGVPDLHLMTAGIHTQNFVGCLAELALNGQRIDLMANAIDGQNVRPCREWRPLRQRRRRQWLKRLLRRQRMRKAAAAEGRRRKG